MKCEFCKKEYKPKKDFGMHDTRNIKEVPACPKCNKKSASSLLKKKGGRKK